MRIVGQLAIRALWLGVGIMIGHNWRALKDGRKPTEVAE